MVALRHAIFPPKSKEPFYFSTQVFGFDRTGLTLDYFDTAGSFKFNGKREKDRLNFEWVNGNLWKKSHYWTEDDGSIGFHYQSMDADRGGEPALSEFKGTLNRQ